MEDKIERLIEEKVEERVKEERERLKSEMRDIPLEDKRTGQFSRRSFLKKIGAGAIGIGALSLAPASGLKLTKNGIYDSGVERKLMQEGTDSGKPSAGVKGRYYYAKDVNLLYRDNGSSWEVAAGTGTTSSPVPVENVQSLSSEKASITNETLIRFYPESDTSLSAGSWTNMPVGTVEADELGEVDAANNKINLNSSGWRLVVISARFDSPSDNDALGMKIQNLDTSKSFRLNQPTAAGSRINIYSFATLVNLPAGTNIAIQVRNKHNSDTLRSNETQTYVEIRDMFRS